MEFAELILIPKLDGVVLHSPLNESVDGTLCITGHHLILSSRREGAQELWLLHQCIDHIERRPLLVNNAPLGGTLVLRCKDLRIISLQITGAVEFANVAKSIEQLASVHDVHHLYAFFYRPMYSILEDGYTAFSIEAEFAKLLATDEWRLSSANAAYAVCPTYGAALVVPCSITDEDVRNAAAFREGGRIPVLSYRHENGCVLLRSAQPSARTSAPKRSRADEAMLNVHLGQSKKGFIVDTWGRGKTETDQHYPQWRKIVRPIWNVAHVGATLEAFARLVEACNDTKCSTERWLGKLDASGWLSLVLSTLNTACVVAQCLDQEGSPVLVNGGGLGLDTPLLITSLVQIILSPDCRTVRGLEALIEREWIQAGFPFTSRHRKSAYATSGASATSKMSSSGASKADAAKAAGSTFVLFLDCVYQLHCQFPCSFEFDADLLVVLFEHSFASQYGTFLGDSEAERDALRLKKRTTSLWSYLNRPNVLQTMLNPIYVPNQEVIWPSVAPISLELWSDLYLRWVIDQSRSKTTMKQIHTLVTREKELRAEALRMRKELLDLAAKFDDSLLPISVPKADAESTTTTAGGGANAAAAARLPLGSGSSSQKLDGSSSGATISVGGAADVGGGGSSSIDGGSTSSGLGGSSSTIASSSSSSSSSSGAVTTAPSPIEQRSSTSSRRSTGGGGGGGGGGEFEHPLQS